MDLPTQPVSGDVTPSQAAETSAASVVQQRIEEHNKRYEDSLDIRDPSVKREAPVDESKVPSQAPGQPKTLPGATPNNGVTPELLARAREWNIPAEEAATYKPQDLTRLLDRFEATQQRYEPEPEPEPQYGQQFQQNDFAFDPYTGQPIQRQQQYAFDPYTGQPLQQQAPQLPRLDPEQFHPDLVAAWDQQQQILLQQQEMIAQQAQQVQQFQQQMQQREAAAQARQNQEDFRKLETLISKDEDYKDVFGEGPAHNLVGTKAHNARAEVAQMMDDLAAGYQRRGQPVPDMETLYSRAKTAVHGYRAPKQQQVTVDRARNATGQFIGRPTATTRNGEPPAGVDRAVLAVEQTLRQQGRLR